MYDVEIYETENGKSEVKEYIKELQKKSNKDKKIAGVCGGLAEYLKMDPTIVRLIWALFVVFAGSGILAYIVCALVIPEEPSDYEVID